MQNISPEEKLKYYIEALRPIIYIPDYDFQEVDKMIKKIKEEVAKDRKIYEFNEANGHIDFENKNTINKLDLFNFLGSFEEAENDSIVILKDINHHFSDPKIIARLKSLAIKPEKKEEKSVTIFIISATLNIPTELDKFITVFERPAPELKKINEVICNFCDSQDINYPQEEEINELAISLKGLSEFEIGQILNLAFSRDGLIGKNSKDFILQEKEQIIKKSGLLEFIQVKEKPEEIGGLEKLMDWLNDKAKIFNHLDKALKFGVDSPKGVLIVGMPGCGKSLTAKITSKLFELSLVRLDIGKILGKYVGESEENLRKALKIAESISPCILWIDELEKAFAGIGNGANSSEVTMRLFGFFLTWLQEKDSNIFIVATSNDVSGLPPEFLRKGRFDEMFFVDLPKEEEIKKIFEIHLKKRNKGLPDCSRLAKECKKVGGFSGSDIESVVKEVIEKAFINGSEKIDTDDIIEIIGETKPLGITMKEKIEQIKKKITEMDIKPASK